MRKLTYLLVMLVLAFSFVGTAAAQKDKGAQSGAILYEEDFESGVISEDVFLTAQWKIAATNVDGVQSNVMRGVAQGVEGMLFNIGYDFQDYAYELKFRVSSAAGISLYTRLAEGNLCAQGYTVDIFPVDEYIALNAFQGTDDCDVESVTGQVPYVMPVNEWITARLEVNGSNHKVYFDEELLIDAEDSTTTAPGSFGLFVFDPTTIEVDYVRVTDLSGSAVASGTTTGTMGNTSGGTTGGGATTGGTTTGGGTTGGKNQTVTLVDFAENDRTASAELETLGLVPAGGTRLFVENYVFADGNAGYVPLASRSSVQETVFSAEITMDDFANDTGCHLLLRLANGAAVFAGVDGLGQAYLVDLHDANGANITVPLGLDMTQAHTVTAILIGSSATIFVDGAMAIDREPVSSIAGSYGFGVINNGRCEARNVWVYQYE